MTSSREKRSLSERLKAIHHCYRGEKNIWDIGCDHGLLGLSFVSTENVESIHLVDPSAEVVRVLKEKIKDSYITNPSLNIHHKKGQELKINLLSNIIFIAGMGGKEIGDIIRHLLPQVDETSKFVISPHRKILELRSLLYSLPLELISEDLIFEDNQFYQIMALRPGTGNIKVSSFGGPGIWQSVNGKAYQIQQMAFFSLHKDKLSTEYVDFLKTLTV